jgi:F-type H+-transporting ATPase subunit alpha
MPVEEQVVVIFAGVNGYLDPLPVPKVRAFEDGLLRMVRSQHPEILDSIRTEREISNETRDRLKAALDAYARTFA